MTIDIEEVIPIKFSISITIHAHSIHGNAMFVFNNIREIISTIKRTTKWKSASKYLGRMHICERINNSIFVSFILDLEII